MITQSDLSGIKRLYRWNTIKAHPFYSTLPIAKVPYSLLRDTFAQIQDDNLIDERAITRDNAQFYVVPMRIAEIFYGYGRNPSVGAALTRMYAKQLDHMIIRTLLQ